MTFSVVVADPTRGLLGAATASCSLAVGNAVPAVWPGVGAVVSQSWTNRSLRGRTLAAVADGADPAAALGDVPVVDDGHALRQLGLVAAAGEHAVMTGEECSPWAGSRSVTGSAGGSLRGVVCGNLLVGPATLDAVAEVLNRGCPDGPRALAAVLVEALGRGQQAGGDVRGQQSAAVLVGSGDRQRWQPPDLDVDLRVDDHPRPVDELGRLLVALRPRRG